MSSSKKEKGAEFITIKGKQHRFNPFLSLKRSFRPDIHDLYWEVVRRNPQYRKDYESLIQDPTAAKMAVKVGKVKYGSTAHYLACCWNLGFMADPKLSWKAADIRIPGSETKIPAGPGNSGFLSSLSQPFISTTAPKEQIEKQEALIDFVKETYPNFEKVAEWLCPSDRLWICVDPRCNLVKLTELFNLTIGEAREKEKARRQEIKSTIRILEEADKIERKNPSPTQKTFRNLYPQKRTYKQKRRNYSNAKILISSPFENPLREIPTKQIDQYSRAHGLMRPYRKKTKFPK
ncbi:MAG: hypothetical protein K9L59_10050 [Desulfobacterales bacterium]|nr:hypothetical protein [Desulfobacterales bacterium]